MIALLYDVHGNLPALEAVLADARSGGAERFLLGGDYALFGAWPAETVDRLGELEAIWIRGNGERWTAKPEEAPEALRPAIAAWRELLGAERVERLGDLAETHADGDVLYCHASPQSDLASFSAYPAAEDDELLVGTNARRVVFGHTHVQFARASRSGVELVNPGSVGMPFDGDPRAAYALVHDDGRVEPRRVRYDHEASAKAVRKRLGELGETPARRIEQARFDV